MASDVRYSVRQVRAPPSFSLQASERRVRTSDVRSTSRWDACGRLSFDIELDELRSGTS